MHFLRRPARFSSSAALLAAALCLMAPSMADDALIDLPPPIEEGEGMPGVGDIPEAPPPVAPPAPPAAARDTAPADAFMYVSVTAQRYRFPQPWERMPPQRRRGMGVLIGEGKILATAELVADATFIELERATTGQRLTARVVFRDYECNLAVLEPVAPADGFFDGMKIMEIDTAGNLGDVIEVWQFEDDGTPLVSEGWLSRALIGSYFIPDRRLLRYEFKGSLQNRGGSFILPAVRDGRLTGIVLGYNASDQIADILPAPIIRRFLDDLAEGEYTGFPVLGITYARTTDDQFRRWLGLEPGEGGIYINRVRPQSAAAEGGLLDGDVLLAIDGFAIDRRGFYQDPDFGPLDFGHLISGRPEAGQTLEVDILRDGERMQLQLTPSRTPPGEFLVEPYMFDRGPRFLMTGGVLFKELTRPFLLSFRDWTTNAPIQLVEAERNQELYNEDRRKLVFLAYTLPTPATVGYERISSAIVERVNGRPIGDIRDLAEALDHPQDGLHTIALEGDLPVLHLDVDLVREVDRQLEAQGIQPMSRLE